MNAKQHMIIANNRIITSDVMSCKYNNQTKKYDVIFKNGKAYHYSYNSVTWLKEPKVLNPTCFHISHDGRELFNISEIYVFRDGCRRYWHICFENNTERDYNDGDLLISESVLDNAQTKDVFEYLRQSAALCSLKGDDGTKLLPKQYEKLGFIGKDTALAAYLNPTVFKPINHPLSTPVFPFGCNASQFKAVKNALENQISIIEGPPGTGKTQTILNIIANLVMSGKTVQIVSNNNTAIENVYEKLASEKYRMDFIVAILGKTENKKNFISRQSDAYPNLTSWSDPSVETDEFIFGIRSRSMELHNVFVSQERLATAKQELQSLSTEQKHFELYLSETSVSDLKVKTRRKLRSSRIMDLWQFCQSVSEREAALPVLFKIKSCFLYGISDWNFYSNGIEKIITAMQRLFYQTKENELREEISDLENRLKSVKSDVLMEDFTQMSLRYLKNSLYRRYGTKESRAFFKEEDLWKNPGAVLNEYPVVLSTAFSSRSSLCKSITFDYVIMDEASQVDVSTGALALSSAHNAVIVGDTKQLPNVITENDEKRADAIFDSFKISDSYCFAHKSFLQSVSEILPDIPQTLLCEHYRCHPKIINFCNQKFYNGQLIIMTEDHGETDVLSVIKTAVGNHARGHLNQRQIDVVNKKVLPSLSFQPKEIGIIAPYNDQVNAMKTEITNNIDVATVHKFQGREKEAVILTTVDNEVTDFTDDPYLLNVAVSRAKKKLCLIVSGNEQPSDSNIGDLIDYIEYNNFSVTESRLYSVFDYLYSQYTKKRFEYLQKQKKISEYNSENLMYALIIDSLREMDIDDLNVVCHQPLNMLIRDPELLDDAECKYAMNSATHLDFLIFNRISKKPVLAIEVDGFGFHKEGTRQAERDKMKNHILELYNIPYVRFATNGSEEKDKLIQKLKEILGK